MILFQANLQGGSSNTLSAETLSLPVSGSAGLRVSRRLTCSAQSNSVTFNAAGLRVQRRVTGTVLSVPSSSGETGLRVARRLTCQTQSISVSFVNAGILYGRKLSADVSSIPLTGSATLKADKRIQADLVNYPLSDSPASVAINRRLYIEPLQIIVTGSDSSPVGSKTINISPYSFDVSFSDASFNIERALRKTSGGSNTVRERIANDDNEVLSIIKAFIECQN